MARLVFRGEGARDGDVLEHGVRVEAKALGDRLEALGAEGALGVDDHALAVGAAVLLRDERAQRVLERASEAERGAHRRQLRRDGERVAELRLARAELAEDLGDAGGLDAAAEESVEIAGTGRDLRRERGSASRAGGGVGRGRIAFMISARFSRSSVPVRKSADSMALAASLILLTLASERPLIWRSLRVVVNMMSCGGGARGQSRRRARRAEPARAESRARSRTLVVWTPDSLSFLMSVAETPFSESTLTWRARCARVRRRRARRRRRASSSSSSSGSGRRGGAARGVRFATPRRPRPRRGRRRAAAAARRTSWCWCCGCWC